MPAVLLLAALLGPAAPPTFTASGPDDTPTGRLVTLAADGTAVLAVGDRTVSVRGVVSLRNTALRRPDPPRGPALLTTTGDRIPGTLLGGDAQALRFRPAFAGPDAEWKVPVAYAAAVWLTRPPADVPLDPARYAWLADNRRRDALLFRNGDTLRGALSTFTPAPAAVFEPETGALRTVPFGQFAAIAFNPSLARTRKPTVPYAHVVLRDGTRLDLTNATAADRSLRGRTLFGESIAVPLGELVSLDVLGGRAAYLSDLKPRAVEQAGFLGAGWPWSADRTVRGAPLRLATAAGVESFDKGLGTHPRTVLTYHLGGKYRRFDAVVGLDPVSGSRGGAVVKVLVDGTERQPTELTALVAGDAVPLRVNVRGAKELRLVVDFGPGGDVQADVNWGEARLIE